jgi:DNA-binding SARP family transcriptional activator
MKILYARLFGKFTVAAQPNAMMSLEGAKVQELFSYLLLYRNRPHAREKLATLLWCDNSATQSKGYLRKTLWQLQSELDCLMEVPYPDLLQIDGEWVQLNAGNQLWLDVAQFEQVFAQVKDTPGYAWNAAIAQQVIEVVALYRGDLLPGCYQEWCLFERERLQRIYLILLEKLMHYCETHGQYDTGVVYGTEVLRYDLAREHTHRSLMRLHYLAGNRSEALHQYERCVKILREELDVAPDRQTKALYEQLVTEELPSGNGYEETAVLSPEASLRQTLQQLEIMRAMLTETQQQVQHNIALVEATLNKVVAKDRSQIRANNAVRHDRLLPYPPDSDMIPTLPPGDTLLF